MRRRTVNTRRTSSSFAEEIPSSSLDSGKESRSTADFFSDTVDSEFTESSTSEACNPGSVGHPELCRRPCIFFANGECRNSESCSFCHLSHAHRSSTLDKKQRQLLKELTSYEYLHVLLCCLRSKAKLGGFEEEATDLLELFEERLREEPKTSSGAKVSSLEKALARMTFFSVASLTTRAKLEEAFLDRCKQTVCKLRERFEQ